VIRPAEQADVPGVLEVALSAGLFPAEEIGIVAELMTDYFATGSAAGHLCLVDVDGAVRGVAYAEPVRATVGTFELTMIAVDGKDQGRGLGTALLARMERDLAGAGVRLLLVQTSGSDDFARSRRFYAGLAYDEEALVRDYYEDGEDMALFRKAL
jgi:ribosomal protein S18 acetylase RimI-like enzyme